jgi:hypothetical protein
MIGTDYTGSCKFNYHAITATTVLTHNYATFKGKGTKLQIMIYKIIQGKQRTTEQEESQKTGLHPYGLEG